MSVDVKPLREHYALVTVPARTRSTANLNEQIRQQSYVEDTLPVLSLSSTHEENPSAFVLPNEIVVSFEPDLSNSQIQTLLDRYNLKVIRPLRFNQNRYLVRSNAENGSRYPQRSQSDQWKSRHSIGYTQLHPVFVL